MDGTFIYWSLTAMVVVFMSWLTMFSVRKLKGKELILCTNCRFNNPVDCLKSERPNAISCTSYRPTVETTAIEIENSDKK